MTFDKDLRFARRTARALFCANLGLGIGHCVARNWGIAFSCVVWAFTCFVWTRMITAQQVTRDMGRILEAGLHAIEKGEL